MTLAIADLPSFSTALVAEEQGFFAAEGLDLKTIHCVNGKRCLKHLIDGEAGARQGSCRLIYAANG